MLTDIAARIVKPGASQFLRPDFPFLFVPLLLVLLSIPTGLASAEPDLSDDVPWGPVVRDLQVRLLAEKQTYTPADPLAIRLQIRNVGTEEIRLRLARSFPAHTSPSGRQVPASLSPELFRMALNDSKGRAIIPYYSRLFERDSHDQPPPDGGDITVPLRAGGPPVERIVYLESGGANRLHPNPIDEEGTCTVEARLLSTIFLGFDGRPLSVDPSRNGDEYRSNPCSIFISRHDQVTSTTWHDGLNWWESITLTLFDDGRFLFNFFSDAGGSQPPVKGTWRETSDTVVLEGVVNRDVIPFGKHRIWKKVQVDRWTVLMPPDVAAAHVAGTRPTTYPVLSPAPPENPPSLRMRRRPWDDSTSGSR